MTTASVDRRFYLATVRAMSNEGYNGAAIAEKLGTSVTTVVTLRNVLALPNDVQEAFASYQLTLSQVAAITRARHAGTLGETWARIGRALRVASVPTTDPAPIDLQPRYLIVRRMTQASNPTVRDTLAWVLGLQANPPA